MECKNREINLQRHLTYSLRGDQIHTCTSETGGVRGWQAHVPEGLIFGKHQTGESLKTEHEYYLQSQGNNMVQNFL